MSEIQTLKKSLDFSLFVSPETNLFHSFGDRRLKKSERVRYFKQESQIVDFNAIAIMHIPIGSGLINPAAQPAAQIEAIVKPA